MTEYVAFLRGVNSGKNPAVKMEVLRKAFEAPGFKNIRTILASGNVLFETDYTDENILEQKIEKMLQETIGFNSDVIVRTIDDLHKLALLNPFKTTEVTQHTRSCVTFVKGRPETSLRFPARGKGYTILGIFNGVVCSVVDLSEVKTPSLMQILDKEFGKGITTRNWNTVERILKVS
ncbi:DUF1697 domain-containing protein [Methanosarcina sp. T3]|uniref:DUF1697 domain-containing protein n=1 Tax=Methanosarcina sp. T3 TaxID=3439062 RepID=UPI003F874044